MAGSVRAREIFNARMMINSIVKQKNNQDKKSIKSRLPLFGIFLLSIFILYACNKSANDINDNQNNYVSLELNCNDDIIDAYINLAALTLLELGKDIDFRNLIHNEIEKMFDDDHNVLLKTANSYKNVSSFGSSFSDTALLKTLERHNDIKILSNTYVNLSIQDVYPTRDKIWSGIELCGKTNYLQIYIPNFETIDLNQIPVIAVNTDDDPFQCVTFGYTYQNNKLVVIDLDSSFAANNLIWVVSINDVVTNQGELPDGFFKLQDTLNLTFNSNLPPDQADVQNRTQKDKAVRIHSIRIARKKRTCWLCGKDPVAVVGYLSDFRNCQPVDNARPFNTDVLCKVGKNDLDVWIKIPDDKPRAWITPHQNPLRRWNEAIEFVMFTKSNRSKYSNSFICDDPNCPSPVPFGMRATYLSRYSPYGQTTYIGTSGNRPLFYFDILTTFGIGMITSPTYDWFGNSIRFEGGDALPF